MPAILIGFLGWQGLVMYRQLIERQEKYRAARESADLVGKPLLVVGGPHGSGGFLSMLSGPSYGWGDVCLDIDPDACAGSPPECQVCIADVREIPYPSKYFGAAFVSHVLEHLPTVAECNKAWNELHRVASEVYVAAPSKQSVLAHLIPDHYLWVTTLPDNSLRIEQR